MMPLGFHLGWNYIITLFYTSKPYGQLLFQELSRNELTELPDLYYSLFVGLIPPIITFIFVKSMINHKIMKDFLE